MDQIFIFSIKEILKCSGMTKTSNLNSLWRFPHHTFWTQGFLDAWSFYEMKRWNIISPGTIAVSYWSYSYESNSHETKFESAYP